MSICQNIDTSLPRQYVQLSKVCCSCGLVHPWRSVFLLTLYKDIILIWHCRFVNKVQTRPRIAGHAHTGKIMEFINLTFIFASSAEASWVPDFSNWINYSDRPHTPPGPFQKIWKRCLWPLTEAKIRILFLAILP